MIFLTVGTILPFDRLVRALDDWAADETRTDIFGQIGDLGPDNYRPRAFPWQERLTPMEFRQRIETADIIVAHAGIGTIVDALTRSKPVVIMARRHALREHVNDHQLETVRKFADRPGVHVVEEPRQIGAAMAAALSSGPVESIPEDAQDSLIAAISDALHGRRAAGPAS